MEGCFIVEDVWVFDVGYYDYGVDYFIYVFVYFGILFDFVFFVKFFIDDVYGFVDFIEVDVGINCEVDECFFFIVVFYVEEFVLESVFDGVNGFVVWVVFIDIYEGSIVVVYYVVNVGEVYVYYGWEFYSFGYVFDYFGYNLFVKWNVVLIGSLGMSWRSLLFLIIMIVFE